jgi:dolichol-phosphate mannosyltransferase
MHRTHPALSVVVPCYNEEAVLDALHDRLSRVCDGVTADYEIVLVNDGSHDSTWAKVGELVRRDRHIVGVNLARNYGHQLALTAGLSVCRGERVLVLDADLQDPPEALPEMLELMDREAADVVYGQRLRRDGETWLKKLTAHAFYRVLGWLVDTPIPPDTGDFRLLSRRVLEQFLAMPERHRYVRGMMSWLGFRQVPYRYERHARHAGESHYTFRRMVRLAWDAVAGFSTKPLTLPTRVGWACAMVAGFKWLLAGWWWLARRELPGVGLLTGLVLLLAGGQFITLGIMGEYLGRMYQEVRGRPLYVIESVIGAGVADEAVPVVPPAVRREAA